MPIPSSEPGKFKSVGSSGVQPDIGIGSNYFRAIAGFGKDMQQLVHERKAEQERLDKETEKALNRTARSKANLSNRSLGRLLSESVSGEEIKNRPELWASQLDDTVSALNEEFELNLPPGISDEMREELMEERRFWVEEERTKLAGAALGQIEKNKNVAIQAEAEGLAMTGDLDGANEIINEMSVSDAEKTLLSKRANKITSQAQRAFINEVESGYSLSIQESQSVDDINQNILNIQNDERFNQDETTRNGLLKRAEGRRRSLQSEAYRRQEEDFKNLKSASQGVISGAIVDVEELEIRGVPQEYINVMGPIMEGIDGNSGIASPKFKEAMKSLENYIGNGKPWLDLGQDQRKEIETLLKDKSFSYDARLKLGAQFARALNADVNDNDISLATADMELDDNQTEVVKRIQGTIFEKIRGTPGPFKKGDIERITFRKSLLDPLQMSNLFNELSKPELIEKFAELEKEDSDKLWDSEIQPKINNAVRLSIQQDLSRQIDALRPTR